MGRMKPVHVVKAVKVRSMRRVRKKRKGSRVRLEPSF